MVRELRKRQDAGSPWRNVKVSKKPLIFKRECEEFEMAVQCKSKLYVYRELKRKVVFEKCLQYVKEHRLDCFFF